MAKKIEKMVNFDILHEHVGQQRALKGPMIYVKLAIVTL